MDEITINNILYDYYGELLTESERSHFEDYYFHNLTLAEIAQKHGLSRNAIHKTIKKVESKLKNYEDKLKLHEKSKQIKEIVKDKELLKKIEEIL